LRNQWLAGRWNKKLKEDIGLGLPSLPVDNSSLWITPATVRAGRDRSAISGKAPAGDGQPNAGVTAGACWTPRLRSPIPNLLGDCRPTKLSTWSWSRPLYLVPGVVAEPDVVSLTAFMPAVTSPAGVDGLNRRTTGLVVLGAPTPAGDGRTVAVWGRFRIRVISGHKGIGG
jgi:hypothetical protein